MDRLWELLIRLRGAFSDCLGKNMVGLYLHGSAAFGDFRWETSDVDLLAVTEEAPSLSEKAALIRALLDLEKDAPKKGVEMSVVTRRVCAAPTCPTPYELHFSPMYRDAALADAEAFARDMHGEDADLPAHFAVTRAVGVVLMGPPVREVFFPVPERVYMQSVLWDLGDCEGGDCGSDYAVLNLCRTLAHLKDGATLSKAGGGDWALRRLGEKWQGVILPALNRYLGRATEADAPEGSAAAEEFARWALPEIRLLTDVTDD